MKGKKNESNPAAPESSSLRHKVTLQITPGEVFRGLCLLYGPIPPEPGADRVLQVRECAEALLKETFRLVNPKFEEAVLATIKAQDETLFRYLGTEKNLKELGIPKERSVFYYLRQHGINKYKTVEHLTQDLVKAALQEPILDPYSYARKHPPLEMFVLNKTGAHIEPQRISTLTLDHFIKWRIQRKKAKAKARTEKSREKSTEILT